MLGSARKQEPSAERHTCAAAPIEITEAAIALNVPDQSSFILTDRRSPSV